MEANNYEELEKHTSTLIVIINKKKKIYPFNKVLITLIPNCVYYEGKIFIGHNSQLTEFECEISSFKDEDKIEYNIAFSIDKKNYIFKMNNDMEETKFSESSPFRYRKYEIKKYEVLHDTENETAIVVTLKTPFF